jgi:hypothetical protein
MRFTATALLVSAALCVLVPHVHAAPKPGPYGLGNNGSDKENCQSIMGACVRVQLSSINTRSVDSQAAPQCREGDL